MNKVNITLITLTTLIIISCINSCKKLELTEITKIQTNPASEVGVNSATISAYFISLGEDVTSFGHCCATSSNPLITDAKVLGEETSQAGEFQSTFSNLAPNTRYFVRAYAMEGDIVIYSHNEITFTTDEGISTPTVTTDIVTNLSQTSATCGGEVTSNGGSSVTSRGVCWSKSQNPLVTDNSTVDGSGIGNFTSTLSGLLPGTNYYVRAYATNSAGTAYGQEKAFSTLQPFYITINSPSAGNKWIIGQTYSINWTDNISENIKIELHKGGSFNSDISTDYESSGSYSWLIPASLVAGTDYSVKIISVTNSEIYSESAQFEIVESSSVIGTVNDIDGNVYNTVKIGNQWWMAENLKVTKYADGTTIPLVTDNTAWSDLNYYDKAYCYFDAGIYGNLYTWAAASGGTSSETNPSGQQGICPTGWHLPSGAEWMELRDYLGGETAAGGKLKETGFTYWASPNTNATNETGFTARPAGWRNSADGSINDIGSNTIWWSSSYTTGQCWYLQYDSGSLFNAEYYDGYGLSVRCVQD